MTSPRGGIRRMVCVAVTAAAAAVTAAGCSDSAVTDQPVPDNPLAHCAAVTTEEISATVAAPTIRTSDLEPLCTWRGDRPHGVVDVTYVWSEHDSLQLQQLTATRLGYTVEHITLTHEQTHTTGFYWRDPHDPGTCGVSAADNGVLTWWVQNRDHTAQPDPCAAALHLAELSIKVEV